jgi:glycosyltransferase involved in cell wall biosynthesis
MKVLLIAPAPPPVGGIESVTDNLVNFLKTNPDGTNLILYNTTHRYRPVTSQSLAVRLFSGITNALETYFKVIRTIKNERPDIIHFASSSSLALFKDFLIVKAAIRSKIPVVMHWHFGRIPSLQKKSNWEWRLLQKVIRKSTMSIVIDQKSYDSLVNEGFSNVTYVANPLAFDIEKKATDFIVWPNHRQSGRLIYVGHIIKDKGVFELVEACVLIPSVNELILIGPYEETIKKELIKLAKLRSNGNWLRFTGAMPIGQVLDYMLGSPVLVLPSYTEGFPMVIIEAMAMGCAIVATDVGAIPEMLAIETNSACGLCIPPRNIEKLHGAILELTDNPDEIETFGKRGMERVLKNYTIENVFGQYKAVWEKALNHTG